MCNKLSNVIFVIFFLSVLLFILFPAKKVPVEIEKCNNLIRVRVHNKLLTASQFFKEHRCLARKIEVRQLQGISLPEHVKDHPVARIYRTSKFNVTVNDTCILIRRTCALSLLGKHCFWEAGGGMFLLGCV